MESPAASYDDPAWYDDVAWYDDSGGPHLAYPARRNPHADTVRTGHGSWVNRHGLAAGSGVEQAAWCHPDAPPDELALMAAWYSWATQPADTSKELLDRARTDLLPRTTRGRTADWCRRFAECTDRLSERHPNPGDLPPGDLLAHLDARRPFAAWAATLVERGTGHRPPLPAVAAFADAAVMLADLLDEQAPNAVRVLGELLRCERRTAARYADRLRTARLHQFEHSGADQGLRDRLAGHRELHLRRAGRRPPPGSPNGLGSSAARLAGQYTPVLPEQPSAAASPGYPFALPPFPLPWPARLNPHLEQARQQAKDWAREVALTGNRPPSTDALRRLEDAFADSVGLRNDIYSYRKEIDEEREVSNAVLAVRRLLGGSLQQAVDVTYRLFEQRVAEFQRIADQELGNEHVSYVAALQDWMAGDNEWYRRTGRYRAGSSRLLFSFRPPAAPRGLPQGSAAGPGLMDHSAR